MEDRGLRFNVGKNRLDLIPAWALDRVGEVFTQGSLKYEDNNWKKGMPWTSVIASLKRHLSAWEQGKDFDEEDGLYHMAHLATNALFLLEYYHIYPQGDNRWSRPLWRIGLDVDDVCCDFIGAYMRKFGVPAPNSWKWNYTFSKQMGSLSEKDRLQFFLDIPPCTNPLTWGFEPECYITHRVVEASVTRNWVESNGFPCAEVVNVDSTEQKVEEALKRQLDIFVDDKYETVVAMRKAGIAAYLMNRSHNIQYNAGALRIYELSEILNTRTKN